MKTIKRLFCGLLATVLALGGVAFPARAAAVPNTEPNSFGTNYYIEDTVQDRPFFEVVLPEIAANIKENNKNSINPYFDKLPVANNPENFQGLGSSTYKNINGNTVTAEAFYRVYGDSLHDPNAGMGLLIYQAIQYKLKHPEEDMTISFSTYRTSPTAAVCVLPESKYYGYMRSLYTTNYDEHGFVRISYMFAEAARMGIKVILINQLNSYAVKQYNPATEKTESRKVMQYTTYFKKALATQCYEKYAPGKKVSDFMDFAKVGWTVNDQTGSMQHVKACTVSHYLATDGTEHRNAVFFTTSNLDENDYLGRNGNAWSQTGVIVSDHEPIYRVSLNYAKLMWKYRHKEGIQELRKVVAERNVKQMQLIKSGKESQIPKDEQIVYLGSKTDNVFQLYYTPLGGTTDTWDTVYNPIFYHIDRLTESKDYIELAWNEYGFEATGYIGKTISKKVERAFCQNPNPNNKISVCVTDLAIDGINALKLGTQIGFRRIKNGKKMHAKDFLMSYEAKDGVRHNVSILTSCNYVMVAFHYRTNSILVINETAATGGNFYSIMGDKYAKDMISKNLKISPAAITLSSDSKYPLQLSRANANALTWTVSDSAVLSVSKTGVITTKKPGKATIKVTDGVTTSSTTVTVVRCMDCYNAGTYCDACASTAAKSGLTFTLSKTSYDYNGAVRTPEVTVTNVFGDKLKQDTDYTVSYDSGRKNAGTYKVTVKMKGNYSGTETLRFKIKPIGISKCSVKLSSKSFTYDGKKKTPSVVVKNTDGKTLKKDTDYTISYDSGRKNVGTYKVTVEMKGNYSGTETLSFKIKPIGISKCSVKLSSKSFTYDGKKKTPSVVVKNADGKTLKKDTDYTVSYDSGRKNVGTYKVTVKMKGNYSGTETLSFKIKPIKISACTVKLSKTSYVYDGKVKTPSVVVKNAKGTTLRKGTHYSVTYEKGRKKYGTYDVTVKMKGNYSGTETLSFKITPPETTLKKLTPANDALKVSITKQTKQTSGYQVQYSTSKAFKKTTTKTIKSPETTLLTLKGLKSNTKYFVRVRTYKTVSGKNYYSGWSTYKSATTK